MKRTYLLAGYPRPPDRYHISSSLCRLALFTLVLFPAWAFLFLTFASPPALISFYFYLVSISMFSFIAQFPLLSFSSPSIISPSLYTCAFLPFHFVFLPLPLCSEMYLVQLKGWGGHFHLPQPFLCRERAFPVSGCPRKQNSGSWPGQILPRSDLRRSKLEWRRGSMCTSETPSSRFLPLLAESAEQWPHFCLSSFLSPPIFEASLCLFIFF